MARVSFTANLQRHVQCPTCCVDGSTVGEVLAAAFRENPRLRGYIVDDRGRLRKHMVIFVDNRVIVDRDGLSDSLTPDSDVYVMQALSGG